MASPEALYEEPQRLFVANFIGENNQVEGRIVNWNPDECQVEVAGQIVRAFPVAVAENDAQTCLTIRPERVALNPAPDGTPATEDFLDVYDVDCGAKNVIYSTVFAYNDSRFPGLKPTTMSDFFDLEKFPGRRGMRRAPNANLEFALVGDGVPADQVYNVLSSEEGIARAFRKLDSIKNQVVWWETGAQPPQMLADGEVIMSTAFNGRIFNAWALENQPLIIVWDGQLLATGYQVIVAGTPKLDLARQFVAFATSTRSLANVTKYISYGPLRQSSLARVDKLLETGIDMKPHLPNAPQNLANAVLEDPE